MALALKCLAEGQLGNAKATLYTCPPATTATVLAVIYVNTDSANRTVNLYFKKSGSTSRRLIGPATTLATTAPELRRSERMTMAAGDIIEGDADVAAKIDYTIFGFER